MMKKNKTQKIFNLFIIILLIGFFVPFFIQAVDTVPSHTTTSTDFTLQPSHTTTIYTEPISTIQATPVQTPVTTKTLEEMIAEAEDNDSQHVPYNIIYESEVDGGEVTPELGGLQGISTDGKATYTLLEQSLPGIPLTTNNFGGYLKGIFNLAIGIASALAVLMIVIGGFKYMTSDAVSYTTAAKEQINGALLGLVLVLASWLILNTINTDLVNFNTNLETVEYTATPTTPVDTTSTDTSTKICWCAGTATSQICFSSKPTSDYGNVYSSTKVSSSTSCPTPTP